MAKLLCPCGNVLSSVQFPNGAIGHLVPQTNADELQGDNLFVAIMRNSRDVWECKACGRLAIDDPAEPGSRKVVWFVPATGRYHGVCDVLTPTREQ